MILLNGCGKKTYNEVCMGGSGAVPIGGSGAIGVVVQIKRGKGSPRKYDPIPNPVKMATKRKMGRPIGSRRKREVKEEPADVGVLMFQSSFMCHLNLLKLDGIICLIEIICCLLQKRILYVDSELVIDWFTINRVLWF